MEPLKERTWVILPWVIQTTFTVMGVVLLSGDTMRVNSANWSSPPEASSKITRKLQSSMQHLTYEHLNFISFSSRIDEVHSESTGNLRLAFTFSIGVHCPSMSSGRCLSYEAWEGRHKAAPTIPNLLHRSRCSWSSPTVSETSLARQTLTSFNGRVSNAVWDKIKINNAVVNSVLQFCTFWHFLRQPVSERVPHQSQLYICCTMRHQMYIKSKKHMNASECRSHMQVRVGDEHRHLCCIWLIQEGVPWQSCFECDNDWQLKLQRERPARSEKLVAPSKLLAPLVIISSSKFRVLSSHVYDLI